MWYSGIDSTNVKNSEQNDTHITAYMNGTESFVATNQKRIRAEFDVCFVVRFIHLIYSYYSYSYSLLILIF